MLYYQKPGGGAMADDDELFEQAMVDMGLAEQSAQREAKDAQAFRDALEHMAPEDLERALAPREPTAPAEDNPLVGTPETLHRRLKRGTISHEAELDLHGMTEKQAERAIGDFLARCGREGRGLVRIVCGRGLHSRRSPVLRDAMAGWLQVDYAQQVSLAFRAPGRLGGEGAWYAVLRRP